MIRHAILLACIVFTGASLAHVVERAWEITVEESPTAITLKDTATGWWHWVPQVVRELPEFLDQCVGTTNDEKK
ncbi:MAG: hypothetical protein WCX61_04660 [Candidatus Peribacteraceae bacterium]|jgi:hypothetical protein